MTAAELAAAAGGTILCGDSSVPVTGIELNSNRVTEGELFVPLIGAKVDAHKFIKDAILRGAACVLTSEHHSADDVRKDAALSGAMLQAENGIEMERAGHACCLIAVEDTKKALQAIGTWYRIHRVQIPLVGVTGSVGKTTTREMIACALSSQKRVFATKGNANSQVGVPITVTEITSASEIGVIELGMSEPGEMERIALVARPDICVITNIGVSHINQLKTQENIMKEKLHILDGAEKEAILIANGDDPLLRNLTEEQIHAYGIAVGKPVRIFFYGSDENADVRAVDIREENGYPSCKVVFQNKGTEADRNGLADGRGLASLSSAKPALREHETIEKNGLLLRLQVRGRHMLKNALAALCVCMLTGVETGRAAEKLSAFRDLSGRGETFVSDGITVIDDSYNAAPDSMKAGLSVLAGIPAKHRIAVLGDMLELGEREKDYHREVGEYIAAHIGRSIDLLLLYGSLASYIAGGLDAQSPHPIEVRQFFDLADLESFVKERVRPGDAVLFKASNSMGLSALVGRLYKKTAQQ